MTATIVDGEKEIRLIDRSEFNRGVKILYEKASKETTRKGTSTLFFKPPAVIIFELEEILFGKEENNVR